MGFGDGGKGLCVDWLAAQQASSSLVLRFSGGHQVGHTVVFGDKRHTFCNFGAGSFRGVPTYYSEHCTVFPPAMLMEAEHLAPLELSTYFHPLVKVCTPWDIAFNQVLEQQNQHGSCGVGYGTTVMRHRQGVTLFALDLSNPWVFRHKLNSIKDYYQQASGENPELQRSFQTKIQHLDINKFIFDCEHARDLYQLVRLSELSERFQHWIFEGSQGIMLDQEHGIFPHVTPSFTTSKNVWGLLQPYHPEYIQLFYVSRCYQTRHGNGPMTSEKPVTLQNNHHEANQRNQFQGAFRCTELDFALLDYALQCERSHHVNNYTLSENLLITCLDQHLQFNIAEARTWAKARGLKLYTSSGPSSEAIQVN
ncbi:MAG: adenylosuccinate synthetase [Cellvibrionaceae bacterium]|nr:adenylosuccinate synthetase [Cellvibrionaceae bacterium]